MSTVELSVIIPAFNEALALPELLTSLAPLGRDPRVEIIVVDNGSTDDTSTVATSASARVIRISRSAVGQGRNTGAREARGRLFAFLDADVIVTSEWIDAIQRHVATGGKPGIVTGDTYDVVRQPSWIERLWFAALYRRGAGRYINGGNIIIGRNDFDAVGGFDPQMTSGEDVDFCGRCRSAGLRILPDRSFRVMHAGYPSTARQFIARESWHGRSDFRNLGSILRSPVAMLALLFLAAHVTAIACLVLGEWQSMSIAAASIALLCFLCSWYKWHQEPFRIRIANTVVFYFYFSGRTLAALRELGARFGRKTSHH